MSETANQNSPKVGNQVPEHKNGVYKTDIFILKIIAFIVMSFIVGVLVEFPLSILLVIDFIAIFSACIYGRMMGHQGSSQSSEFITDKDRVIPSFVVPGGDCHPSAYTYKDRHG